MKTQFLWVPKSRHCKQCLRGNFCPVVQSPGQGGLSEQQTCCFAEVTSPRQRNSIPGSFPCSVVCHRVEVSRGTTALPSSWEWSATLWICSPYWEITRESVAIAKPHWCSVGCSITPLLPLCCLTFFFTFLWSPGRLLAHSWQAELWG